MRPFFFKKSSRWIPGDLEEIGYKYELFEERIEIIPSEILAEPSHSIPYENLFFHVTGLHPIRIVLMDIRSNFAMEVPCHSDREEYDMLEMVHELVALTKRDKPLLEDKDVKAVLAAAKKGALQQAFIGTPIALALMYYLEGRNRYFWNVAIIVFVLYAGIHLYIGREKQKILENEAQKLLNWEKIKFDHPGKP